MKFKQPISVLVVIYTPLLDVLLLERAAHPGYWQSVTGSREDDEDLFATAIREVREETGIDARRYPLTDWNIVNHFEIYPQWRQRYAPGVTRNAEHVFGLEVPVRVPVTLAPEEHVAGLWMPWREAAQKVFSWSNRDAILQLPDRVHPA